MHTTSKVFIYLHDAENEKRQQKRFEYLEVSYENSSKNSSFKFRGSPAKKIPEILPQISDSFESSSPLLTGRDGSKMTERIFFYSSFYLFT